MTSDIANNHSSNGVTKRARRWHFDTLQVHAGLEESPVYGQCTLPVYNSGSFKFKTSASIGDAFSANMGTDQYIYSRMSNVSPYLGMI
jgi:O-acetylhomoserine/O-acetylserine sulfhydrylase